MYGRRNAIQNAQASAFVGFKASARSTIANGGSGATTIAAPLPTYAAGDLVLIAIRPSTSSTMTTPSGWTLVHSASSQIYLFAKIMTGSEGSSVNISTFAVGFAILSVAYGGIIAVPSSTGAASTFGTGSATATLTAQFAGTGFWAWFVMVGAGSGTASSSTTGAVENVDGNGSILVAEYDLFDTMTVSGTKLVQGSNSVGTGEYLVGCVLRVS